MSEQELHGFLAEQRTLQIATAGPNGRPHLNAALVRPRGHAAARLDLRRVAEIGAALLSRYGGAEELAPEAVEMVRAQAAKRVGLRFSPTRIVIWDHRKLDGTYQ